MDITIDTFYPGSGGVPRTVVDPATAISYSSWELLDEGRFSFRVPGTWTIGSSLLIKLLESTPTASARHKWQAVVQLNRPDVHAIGGTAVEETTTVEYQSSATTGQISPREWEVSDGNYIGGLRVLPGDYVSISLSRIAASTNEDAQPIKILDLAVSVSAAASSDISGCLGRVGSIISEVMVLANDQRNDLATPADILRWVNLCQMDLARRGWFRGAALYDLTSGQNEIDLSGSDPPIEQVHAVYYVPTGMPITILNSRKDWERLVNWGSSIGGERACWIENSTLYVFPTPTTTETDAVRVIGTYVPDPLACDTAYTPATPQTHDIVYVWYARMMFSRVDRQAPGAAQDVATYQREYENAVGELFRAQHGVNFARGA